MEQKHLDGIEDAITRANEISAEALFLTYGSKPRIPEDRIPLRVTDDEVVSILRYEVVSTLSELGSGLRWATVLEPLKMALLVVIAFALLSIATKADAATVCSEGADYTSGFSALAGAPDGEDILFCRGEEFDIGYTLLSYDRSNTIVGAYGEGGKPVLVGSLGLAEVWNLRFEGLRFEPPGYDIDIEGGVAMYAWYGVGTDLMIVDCEFGNYHIIFGVRVPGNYDQEIDIAYFSEPFFEIDENGNYIPNRIISAAEIGYILSKMGTTDRRADINRDGAVGADDLGLALNHWGLDPPE